MTLKLETLFLVGFFFIFLFLFLFFWLYFFVAVVAAAVSLRAGLLFNWLLSKLIQLNLS